MTFKNALDHLKSLFILAIFWYIATLILGYFYGKGGISASLCGGVILYVANLIPQLALHFRYYFLNKDCVLTYDPDLKRIIIKRKSLTVEFSVDDITNIVSYKATPLAENRAKVFPFDMYNYSILYFRNGSQFVLTSLMVKNFDLPINESKKEIVKVFYAFPTKGSVL